MINFQNLQVYSKAKSFCNEVYVATKIWPKEYLFDITSQFRRASLSIPLNIAEGTSRSKRDFSRFIDIAKGSCFECVALMEIANDLSLLPVNTKSELTNKAEEISKMLSGLKRSMNSELRTNN